jgi:hypothetical protein
VLNAALHTDDAMQRPPLYLDLGSGYLVGTVGWGDLFVAATAALILSARCGILYQTQTHTDLIT